MGPPQQSRGGGRDAKATALTSPPPSCLAPCWTPCTDRSYTHVKPLLRAQTTRAERPHHSTKQHTHTHSHTQGNTYNTTHTIHEGGGGRGILSMTPWLTTLTTLQMRRPRGCRRGGDTLPLGGRGILRLGPGPCTRHAHSRGRLQAGMHPAIHRAAPTTAPTTLVADPRHGHGRGRGGGRPPTQSTTTTTNTSQTGATGWRHGQWHCTTPHTVATPGTLPMHLPLLHPLPTRQWGCNWGRRHVHSPTTCTLPPCTPPRRCSRDRGHWLGHHTTNVTVTATATVTVPAHTSTPTTHTRPTPRPLSRRRQWRRRRRRPTPAVPTQRLCSTILHLWWATTWAPHRAWRRTAPRRCLLPRLDHARYIHLGIHTCWFAGQPRSRQLPQR